jgi:hypothetical protein
MCKFVTEKKPRLKMYTTIWNKLFNLPYLLLKSYLYIFGAR